MIQISKGSITTFLDANNKDFWISAASSISLFSGEILLETFKDMVQMSNP